LGAAPAPQTLALHQSILNGQLNGYTPPAISGPAVQSPLEAVFVGRRAELDALHALLADARQGRGRLVSLTGEAGVGKTRLANALLEQAAQHHLPVISARCQEVEQTLPFAPLVEALETFMLRRPGDPLQTLLPPDRAQLAQLLPSLAWEVDLQANGGGLPEHNRQRLVAGLTRTLLHLGQDGLLLFVDDLHWVDEATLSLLANLSRYLPRSKLIVLTACRPEEVTGNRPLARFLHSLARQQMLTTFTLPRLSAAEVETFLRQIAPPIAADAPLNRQLAHRLHHLTGGNPLFLVESLRALLDDIPHTLTPAAAQRLLNSPTLEQPSPRVTDIILTRLEQLPPNVRVLLDITAVIGRDFSVDLLETVATTDPLPALNLLLARQFMLEPEPGRLDFSHHLIREVIYNALSPLARQRLHQRVAHALIALHGKQPGPRAAEIAAHSRRAGAARRQQALVFAVLAGDYAMRTFGFEQAARQYRQAIEWVEELPPTAELETWARQAFEGLGLAQESLADWDAARRTYQRWQSWAQKHRHPHLALVARHRLATMLGLIGQLDESAAITASVSKQASPAPPPALVRAQARLKRLISTDVSPPTWTDAGWPAFMPYPVKEARPWEGIVRALGEAQAAQTLNLFGWAVTLQGQSTLAEATLLHAAQLAETHNQTGLQATSYHLLAQLWDLRGDYSNMERALSLALSLVEDAPPLRWAVIWGLIHQAYVDMRWNQLERAGERLHRLDGELSGRSAFRSHRLSVQVGLGLLAMFTGKLAQAAAYFDRALENLKNLYASNYVVVYLSRARLNRKQGNLEAAQHYIMQAMTFAGERGMLADYISAAVEAARFDRATGQPHYVIHLLQQAEAMASQAGLLPARLSARLALMRVFDDLAAPDEAAWYRRLARADRDTIAASIPTPADRSAYLARHDFKLL
ncbi:MAG: AAA family ATPase, partial [Anaerolineae bacterium]